MTYLSPPTLAVDTHKHGLLFVFAAGVLWSTVGPGIRMIEDAVVWQILLYRSISMSLFLYMVIRLRSGESPFLQIRRIGLPVVVAGLSLVAAYSGGIYAIQNTSVANAMLLFATAPFMAAVLGWLVLREPVRAATWIAIAVALGGILIMVSDKTGDVAVQGSNGGARPHPRPVRRRLVLRRRCQEGSVVACGPRSRAPRKGLGRDCPRRCAPRSC